MQKTYKKLSLMTIGLALSLSAAMMLFSRIVDPCNIYEIGQPYQTCGARYFHAGRIRHHLYKNSDYETLSFGSSVSQNFLESDLERHLGWKKPMRVYIPGYYINEADAVLRYALDSKKITKVLWGLDAGRYETQNPAMLDEANGAFPEYLYNSAAQDDLPYLLSYNNIKKFIDLNSPKRIKKKRYPKSLQNADFDFWADSPFNFNFSYNFIKELPKEKKPKSWTPQSKHDFPFADKYILELAKDYPNVEFYLFFPPYPYIYSNIPLIGKTFDDYLDLRKYLVQQTAGMPNVKIFDFTEHQNVLGNLAYYRDSGHYQPNINTAVLKRIGQGKDMLTEKNIDRHNKAVAKILKDYTPYVDFEASVRKQPVLYEHPRKTADVKSGTMTVKTGEREFPYSRTLVFKVVVDVPENGTLTVSGQPRNDRGEALLIPLKKGKNTEYFVMNMLPAKQNLTFEFKAGNGKYVLHELNAKLQKEDF